MLQPSTKPETIEANAVVVNDGPCAPATPAKLDPAWDRARELLQTGKALAIELADEIERLRSMYLRDGHKNIRRGNSPVSQVVTPGESFTAKLQSELGLHQQQASRILESADYQRRILLVSKTEVGEFVDFVDQDGKKHVLDVTEEHKALAAEAVKAWGLPFSSSPARQWAGIVGGGATRGTERAPADPGKLLVRAVRSLGTNLGKWSQLSPVERSNIEQDWGDICAAGLIPDTFVAALMSARAKRK